MKIMLKRKELIMRQFRNNRIEVAVIIWYLVIGIVFICAIADLCGK